MNTAFQLDGLHVDPSTGEVSGPGGREKLDPKVMEVLVFLAGRAGEVVSREELHAGIWPNSVVTDDALSRCFYELRRQLSRAAGDERFRDVIETLPKRGYRLNGSVRVAEARRRRHLALGAMVVAALTVLAVFIGLRRADAPNTGQPPANSIAVLPFTDMSPAGDQRYFSDGISEEILNRLVDSTDLRVIARTSSFSFRDRPVDIPEIAAKLDVSHVLEGSVRRSGDRVRITAQLISASTNAHVWSDTYDRNLGDMLAVQGDIATEVAAALDATLGGKSAIRPPNAEAYERYLQGRYFYNRRAPGDLKLMAKYLEEAVAIDPGFAKGWSELAGAYHLLGFEFPEVEVAWRSKQREAGLRAVQLDPDIAEAHVRLSQYYSITGNHELDEAHYRKAVALDPDNLLMASISAGMAIRRGEFDKAVEIQSRVVARDPLSATQRNNLGSYLTAAGRYEEALAEYRVRDELNPHEEPRHRAEFVRLLVLLERFDEASAMAAAMPEGKYRNFGLALLFPAPGHRAEADAALQRLAAKPPKDDILLAEAYAQRGMNDEAIEAVQWIMSALEQDAAADQPQIHGLRHLVQGSPFLRDLRPRLLELTTRPAN